MLKFLTMDMLWYIYWQLPETQLVPGVGVINGAPFNEMLMVSKEWPPGMDQKWCFVTNSAIKGILDS